MEAEPGKASESAREPAGAKESMLRIDGFLCFAVYAASHAFTRMYKPLLEALGVTYPQYLALVALWARDGRTVGELGDVLFLESNTLTPLLKRLEAAGLVTRQRDAADERQVRVRLTAAGRGLQAKAEAVPGCVLAATGLPAGQVKRLTDEIMALRAALAAAAPAV